MGDSGRDEKPDSPSIFQPATTSIMKTKLYSLLLIPAFACCTSNPNDTANNSTTTDGKATEATGACDTIESNQPRTPAHISIEWSKNADNSNAENVHEAVLSENCAANFTLSTDGTVSNLKMLNLQLLEGNEDGVVEFSTEESFSLERFTENERLIVCGEMFGTIPNLGLSYEEDGQTKYFAIIESGEDGSLSLSPINQ